MEIYLVGGAIRDQMLGLPVHERDWVVVGATPEEMLALGYKQVGKDFPVFLHPKTHEEYALARTERKTGKGYTGFACYFSKDVTLAEDLQRRDLTINAIAQSKAGKIIDPYGGQKDLKERVLRHVSLAFTEDPVRILRVARFAARFGDFHVASTTLELMHKMVNNGEVDHLVPERIWQELEKALHEPYPHRFFQVLDSCQALMIIFPEIASRVATAIPALEQAAKLAKNARVRFAALLRDVDIEDIDDLAFRAKVSRAYKELALTLAKDYLQIEVALDADAEELLALLESLDAIRRKQRFNEVLLAYDAYTDKHPSEEVLLLKKMQKIIAEVDVKALLKQGISGEALRRELRKQQVQAIKKAL